MPKRNGTPVGKQSLPKVAKRTNPKGVSSISGNKRGLPINISSVTSDTSSDIDDGVADELPSTSSGRERNTSHSKTPL
jgi:hypothetical protein